MVFLTRLATVALASMRVQAALFTDPAGLPQVHYDYIVVGGGVGGSAVASRLSEKATNRVLLIEAGPNHDILEAINVPLLQSTLSPNTSVDWNYTTVPLPGLNNRSIGYARGHVLGGSSCLNYMAWTRGPRDDYDNWANMTGDAGWSWDAVQHFFQKIEKLVPSADGHNTRGQLDPHIHGKTGNVAISITEWPTPIDSKVIDTTKTLPQEFPFNLDMNSGYTLGIGWSQFSIGNGTRASAASSYIDPAIGRPNLDVLLNTQVTRLLQTGYGGDVAFRGVQFSQSATSPNYTLHAKKEVIVSAGAFNTPKLLLLSGIGDPTQLRALGIETIVDLPDVGKHLQDHPLLPNIWQVSPKNATLDETFRNQTLFSQDLREWETSRQGPFTGSGPSHFGWLRLPANASIFFPGHNPFNQRHVANPRESHVDPASGPNAPHYEMLFIPLFSSLVAKLPAEGDFLTLAVAIVSPTSLGSVTLASTDPFAAPLIDPGLLSSDFDIFTMREAVKAAQRYVASAPWDGYILEPFGDFANATTDAEIEAYARKDSGTIWHASGSARMTPYHAKDGVVNPDMTVKKVQGLRIVDASVFPKIPAAHPQAAIYVFAERAAELIMNA